jgi:DEAD/DEAH box helicase domain-containing protein
VVNVRDVGTLHKELLETYLRYVDTPFRLNHPALSEERRRLLRATGTIQQLPIFEFMPGYEVFDGSMRTAVTSAGLNADVAEFFEHGLWSHGEAPYSHQAGALRLGTDPGAKHVVVTTGTGSGKTECFLLPILAKLVAESVNWPAVGNLHGRWWDGGATAHPRASERREPAIRALVVYPLNALVEDQLVRLRAALESTDVRSWLQRRRGRNRFYFGGYNSRTPVSGTVNAERCRRLTSILDELDNEFDAIRASHPDHTTLFQDPRGAEMASRWYMHEYPPDVLITNFAMLNVMLMRNLERNMFASTRAWLNGGRDRQFTLVVDELHSYRGTAGTEVALVIRVLLEQLGLRPTDPRLKIIATSASLGERDESAAFLEGFFGISGERFELLTGNPAPPPGVEGRAYAVSASAFAALPARVQAAGAETSLRELATSLNVDASAMQGDLRRALGERLCALGLPSALLRGAVQAAGPERSPVASLEVLAPIVFGDASPELQQDALLGAVMVCGEASRNDGRPLVRAKGHVFFRNLPGLWACSDPACGAVIVADATRPVGKLSTEPAISCACGARMLDLYYCQSCGDVILGGFRVPLSSGNDFVMTAGFPDVEKLPDLAREERILNDYLFFWPAAHQRRPEDQGWSAANCTVRWQQVWLEPQQGLVNHQQQGHPGWVLWATQIPQGARHLAAVKACPNCGENWSAWNTPQNMWISPIRSLRTAFSKIAQILADRLLADEAIATRRLVAFSDSRRDAATLSYEVEHSHYLDLVRNVALQILIADSAGRAFRAAERAVHGEPLSAEDEAAAAQFQTARSDIWMALIIERTDANSLPPPMRAALAQLRRRRGTPLQTLWDEIDLRIARYGTNPAGVLPEAADFPEAGGTRGRWTSCYTFAMTDDGSVASVSVFANNSIDANRHRDRMRGCAWNTSLDQLFAGRGRSVEALSLGWLQPDSVATGFLSLDVQTANQIAASIVRLLGEKKRTLRYIDNPNVAFGADRYASAFGAPSRLPQRVSDYIHEVARLRGIDGDGLQAAVHQWLVQERVIVADGDVRLEPTSLVFMGAGELEWWCSRCSTRHLHASAGVCTSCLRPLAQSRPRQNTPEDDFYRWLAVDERARRRLHCEELTGMTDDGDARSRLRLFRGIVVPPDHAAVDPIDLLSVTTTMEAGVDIGSLNLVMMANMPPERFNYQQRAGRCGRRGSGFSTVLTVCKGRSHDDYYFSNLVAMTADAPPSPYLDLSRTSVAQRVLAARALKLAFSACALETPDDEFDSVHGRFGATTGWSNVAGQIQAWLAANPTLVRNQVDVLASGAPIIQQNREALVEWVCGGALTSRIGEIAADPGAEMLSEALAVGGVLPLFGFPTMLRRFHHAQPRAARGQVQYRAIDWDADICVSAFAPGAEVVKDKRGYRAVGLAHYVERQGRPVFENPLPRVEDVTVCNACWTLSPGLLATCPSCNEPVGAGAAARSFPLGYPLGYRGDYRSDRPPNSGDEDRTYAGAARIVIPGAEQPPLGSVSESPFWVVDGSFYSINDANGELFELADCGNQGQLWTEFLNGPDAPAQLRGGNRPTRRIALGSRKKSEALLLEPRLAGSPAGFLFDIRDVAVRATMLSFGFLLRRAACTYFDVNQAELRVGIRSVTRQAGDEPRVQAYLADALANGAGYCRHLSEAMILGHLLGDMAAAEQGATLVGMRDHFQTPDRCAASCYFCLLSFENLRYHGLMNWRLAMDVVDVIHSGMLPSANHPRWAQRLPVAWSALGLEFTRRAPIDGFEAADHNDLNLTVVAAHPLMDRRRAQMHVELAEVVDEIEAGGRTAFVCSYFDLLHRPWWVVARGIAALG